MAASLVSPFFLNSAEDLVKRVEPFRSPDARALADEARACAVTFREWLANSPTDDARVAGLQRLFDLNRRVMDFLAKQGPPSSGKRPIGTGSGLPKAYDDKDEDD